MPPTESSLALRAHAEAGDKLAGASLASVLGNRSRPVSLRCGCESCDMASNAGLRTRMSVCPHCGDRRCPRAKSHANRCRERPAPEANFERPIESTSGARSERDEVSAPWAPRKFARCRIHGPEERSAWGCPHCLAELRGENERLREALRRLSLWGGLPSRSSVQEQDSAYSASIAGDVLQWYLSGMNGPLPALPQWAQQAPLDSNEP